MSENENSPSFKVTDRRGQPKEERKPEEAPKQAPPRPEAGPKASSKGRGAPSVDFANFIISLSTSALMHMGMMDDPDGQKVPKNIALARQEVDIIEMLAEKTKGNLTPDEAKLMEQALYELRLRFVEASRQ